MRARSLPRRSCVGRRSRRSSRRVASRFRSPGNSTYPVPTLSLPDSQADLETVAGSEAVRLFVDRARQQQPHFELTAARARAVAELCIHLDGIPLALELAAARVPSLSIDQINARLDDRFRFLTGGARTALPRHQTLRGTLDWSHGLLSENERVTLRRLAIFPGGFALEAASAVASDETIGASDVVDALAHLVLRSLVIAVTDDRGARYRLLETTRAYAMEKLDAAREVEAMRRRHALHFRDRFRDAYDDWLTMSDVDWHVRYRAERDNVRAALDWAFAPQGDNAVGVGLAAGSAPLWAELSLPHEGWQRLDTAIGRLDHATPEREQAQLFLWRALYGRYRLVATGMDDLEHAVALFRRQGHARGLGHALARLGGFLARERRFDQAAATLSEADAVSRHAGSQRVLGAFFSERGLLRLFAGDCSLARLDFERAMTHYRDVGAEAAYLGVLGQLADTTFALGDLDAARDAFSEVIARLRRSSMARRYTLGIALTNYAGLLAVRGELDAALAAAREGLPLTLEAGHAWNLIDHLALRTGLAGNLERAARLTGFADAAYREAKHEREVNEARARARLKALLESRLTAEALHLLFDEGAALSESDACRLALED